MVRNWLILRALGIRPKTIIHIGAGSGEDRDLYKEAVELCFLNKSYSRNNLRLAKLIPSKLDQRNCVRFPEIQYEYLDD